MFESYVAQQSTAFNAVVFVSSITNIIGGVNSLTVVNASKNGAAFADITSTVTITSRGGGWFNIAFPTGATNTLGALAIEGTGLLSVVRFIIQVVAYNPNDALALGLTRIDAAVTTRADAAFYTAARGPLLDNLDVAVSTRLASGTFVVPDNAGIASLNAKLTTGRAAGLDNLDAAVSSRMATFAYVAPDNAGLATLLGRVTSGRAALLDNLDAAVSSRMASFTYTAPDNLDVVEILNMVNILGTRITAERALRFDMIDAAITTRMASNQDIIFSRGRRMGHLVANG